MPPTRSKYMRPHPGFIVAALLFCNWVPAVAQELTQPPNFVAFSKADNAKSTRTYAFTIAPQPLLTALDEYNQITGTQIFYDSRLSSGVLSPGVKGQLSADDALKQLLDGTNLAAIRSSNGTVSLFLHDADNTPTSMPPIHGPTLKLNTLHIDATAAGDHRYYATTVAVAIKNALYRDRQTRQGRYFIALNVWLAKTGEVRDFEFVSFTGDDDINSAITRNLRRIAIGTAPPSDLEQPVRIRIRANGTN